jgi:hypothetical protein
MVREERLHSVLLREALLHLVPLEREVERYPAVQKEKRTTNDSCSPKVHRACVLNIPIAENIKRVDRQHIQPVVFLAFDLLIPYRFHTCQQI